MTDDYGVLAERKIEQYEELFAAEPPMEGLNPIQIDFIRRQRDEYKAVIDGLRTTLDIYRGNPNLDYMKKLIRNAYSDLPPIPIIDVNLMRYTKNIEMYSSLPEAIKHINNAYIIVKCLQSYIICQTEADYDQALEVLREHEAFEVLTEECMQKLAFVSAYNTPQELYYLRDIIMRHFNMGTKFRDLVIHPYQTRSFIVIQTIQGTYAENRNVFNAFIAANRRIAGRVAMIDITIQQEISKSIIETPLIPKMYDERLSLKTILPDRISTMPQNVFNIGGDYVKGDKIESKTEAKTEEKEISNKKATKRWVNINPPKDKELCQKYYRTYCQYMDTHDRECLSFRQFNELVSKKYEKKQDKTRNGRMCWLVDSEDDQ
jgi:hypothetical protein